MSESTTPNTMTTTPAATLRMRSLSTASAGFEAEFERAAATGRPRPTRRSSSASPPSSPTCSTRGDAALLEYTQRFDGLQATSVAALEIGADELAAALDAHHRRRSAPRSTRRRARVRALPRAPARGLRPLLELPRRRRHAARPEGHAARPRRHLRARRQGGLSVERADERHPGARWPASARSSWWCRRRAARRTRWCWPPRALAGVDRVFTIGGAQAVAALAYGTATIPAVDKITGPGNAYVASAKRRVFGTVGIDMIAGPSEILVLADGSTPPDWVAMDLFSQAEHDELAQSILLCPDAGYIDRGAARRSTGCCPTCRARTSSRASLERPRRADPRARAWRRPARSATASRPSTWRSPAPSRTAGSRCCGMPARSSSAPSPARAWATTAPARTTCCRPRGTARFSSPLGVYDFQKRSSLIEVSEAGARTLGRSPSSWPRRRPAGACEAPMRLSVHETSATMRRDDRRRRCAGPIGARRARP